MKKIYYLGPQGSYSHMVAKKVFAENAQLVSCNTFSEIVHKTTEDTDAIGILPIENSITSNVHENMDYLFRENLVISLEAYVHINLYLIGKRDSSIDDIKDVYSHPKALEQCKKYIQEHHFISHETTSTAAAKKSIFEKKEKSAALIGSKELITDGTLKILAENIGDSMYNMTRFVFVNRTPREISSSIKNKASIMFMVPHISGSLAKILTALAQAKFNLTKIDSLPLPGTKWEYQFWIDIENQTSAIDLPVLSRVLSQNTDTYKIIGIYPKGKTYES